MTKLFLRLFVKNWQNDQDPKVRARVGKLSGTVGILCNTLLCALKLVVGTLSGSVSVTADAMNNLSDTASSLVTLVGFKLSEKPADSGHPYGHARYEYLSGLAVAALIMVIGFELGVSSFHKILDPTPIRFDLPMAAVLVGSILVKLWMCLLSRGLGKHIRSSALLATAADSRNDCITTGAVLAAALLEGFTGWTVDGFVGLGVALFILYSGGALAKQTISPLLGEAASPELQALIVKTVSSDPRILGYHDLMVHDYGPGQRFASIHVEMDQREDPLLCHEIIDNLERRCLREHNVHLVIHYDPILIGDPMLDRFREQVEAVLKGIDPRLSMHDFRMVQGKKHMNLIFDVALPADLAGQETAICRTVENTLAETNQGQYHAVITFDPEAFNTIL